MDFLFLNFAIAFKSFDSDRDRNGKVQVLR